MPKSAARPIPLCFRTHDEDLHGELSAIVQVGDDLLLGSDEGRAIERLSPAPDGAKKRARYAHHTTFPLADLLALPGSDEEIDIEGLAVDDGCLWVAGSHSAKRSKPEREEHDLEEALARLTEIARPASRHVLARIPLRTDADGRVELVREGRDASGDPICAAILRGEKRKHSLARLLEDDPHLGPFMGLPGKDNGFNIEGLAVASGRVFLGLRGPVLRGHAVILGLHPRPRRSTPDRLTLARVDADRRYHKYFLDLHGLGIRELCRDGRDLLILAGPTMVLDGRCAVFRWRGALDHDGDALILRDALEPVLELPYGQGVNHPEGLCQFRRGEDRGLLVVYDSPGEERSLAPGTVEAELYPFELAATQH